MEKMSENNENLDNNLDQVFLNKPEDSDTPLEKENFFSNSVKDIKINPEQAEELFKIQEQISEEEPKLKEDFATRNCVILFLPILEKILLKPSLLEYLRKPFCIIKSSSIS